MKKLSEVCKIVGVTRRTLQEYEKVNLLKPTSKTDSGYWLYDDAAIQKLTLIQIFREAGYDRKSIKKILDSSSLDISVEFDNLIETLLTKQKKIAGMINIIKTLKLSTRLPESTLKAMKNLDATRIYQEKSFTSYLKDFIISSSEYSESDNDEEMYILVWHLIAIGCRLSTPANSALTQSVVEDAYKYMMDIAMNDEDNRDSLSRNEFADAFFEVIRDIVSNSEFAQIIELQCGRGAVDYIIKAVRMFSEKYSE